MVTMLKIICLAVIYTVFCSGVGASDFRKDHLDDVALCSTVGDNPDTYHNFQYKAKKRKIFDDKMLKEFTHSLPRPGMSFCFAYMTYGTPIEPPKITSGKDDDFVTEVAQFKCNLRKGKWFPHCPIIEVTFRDDKIETIGPAK